MSLMSCRRSSASTPGVTMAFLPPRGFTDSRMTTVSVCTASLTPPPSRPQPGDMPAPTAYALLNLANGDGPTLATGAAPVFATGAARANKAAAGTALDLPNLGRAAPPS